MEHTDLERDIYETMTGADGIIARLRSLANADNIDGMARFGISITGTLGVSMPALRGMAKDIGRNHELALEIWSSGIHEARILAAFIDDPHRVTKQQMEGWVADIDSWDVCDQCCSNLFDKTPYAYEKAVEWAGRQEEFVKRAGFVLMAALSVHDKKAGDEAFVRFLLLIAREATDSRNFVKKAVNWALRQIGKRNSTLNECAITTAQQIQRLNTPSARWIAADALRELTGIRVKERLKR